MKASRIFAVFAVILAIALSGCTSDGSSTNNNHTNTTSPLHQSGGGGY